MRFGSGPLQVDTGPVPHGRWATIRIGREPGAGDVTLFYVEAWQRWIAAGRAKSAR